MVILIGLTLVCLKNFVGKIGDFKFTSIAAYQVLLEPILCLFLYQEEFGMPLKMQESARPNLLVSFCAISGSGWPNPWMMERSRNGVMQARQAKFLYHTLAPIRNRLLETNVNEE